MYDPYYEEDQKRKRIIKIVIISVVTLLLVTFISIFAVMAVKKNTVETDSAKINTGISVTVVPLNATVTIGDKTYTNGTYQLEPGEYRAKINAEGFESTDEEFKVESGALTPIAVYLKPNGGAYSVDDYDLLRFLSDDNDTNLLVEEKLLDLSTDYKFASMQKSIFKDIVLPLDKTYSEYSKQVILDTITAYFYFAHPDITSYQAFLIKDKDQSFVVSFDGGVKYAINYLASVDETTKAKTKNVYFVSIQKYGSQDIVFHYDGRFTYTDHNKDIEYGGQNFE